MNIQQRLVERIRMNNESLADGYIKILNPDFIKRKQIEEDIKLNDGYCLSKPKEEGNKCVCKEFEEQQCSGPCRCGLYYKVLKAPKVCLCGSTRFKDKFFEVAKDFTLRGCIVTMPMVFVHSGDEEINEVQKEYLDEVHKAKIADADLIYIINCDGYVGNSTRSEINWALKLGKKIEYLES